jgi:hypothetical protein
MPFSVDQLALDIGTPLLTTTAAAPLMLSPGINPATWPERFANYERVLELPVYLTLWPDGWIAGSWILRYYKRHNVDFHGAYPIHLLKRYAALFYDRGRVLHVCAGALRPDNPWLPGDTLDINPALDPTFCCDAEVCAGVDLSVYTHVFVDPPYTHEDAAKYGTRLPIAKRVLRTLAAGLPPGALIVWLDENTPQPGKTLPLRWIGFWGVSTSGGHRGRDVFLYERT